MPKAQVDIPFFQDKSLHPVWMRWITDIGRSTAVDSKHGTAELSDGSATVLCQSVTANSSIHLTINGASVNIGTIYEDRSKRVQGKSFVIKSTNPLDNSNVAWSVTEPT